MHIEYIKTKTSTGKLSHTCILLRQTYRVNGKVKKKTIANLTHVPPEVLGSYKALIKYQKHPEILVSTKEDIKTNAGKSIGAAWTLFMVAKKLHIDEVLGTGRPGKLALYQILSRCLAQGSRLSAIRLNQIHELTNTLGIDFSFHEDHLYKNLFFLFNKQKQFEQELFEKTYEGKAVPDLFLYDVTSSYFEGDQNELSAWGYNRDKKRGKKQVVMGLLCDKDGEAVSVHVFSGNTTDIKTFHSQVEKIKQEFGCQRVTCVTDRGIMKGKQIEELKENDYFYITAITKAQIDHLLKKDVLQMGLFDDTLRELVHEGVRYIFRRNPQRAQDIQKQREDKYQTLVSFCEAKNTYLQEHKKASLDIAVKEVQTKLIKFKCGKWLRIESNQEKRQIRLIRDEQALTQEGKLDGCYVMKTNLAKKDAAKETINRRYKDLGRVEHAFRLEKTGLLELRPWYVITEESTYAHAFIVMLAYKITHYLENAWKSLNLTVEEGLAKLANITTIELMIKGISSGMQITQPKDELSKKLLQLAGITLPEILPQLGAVVVSRKKLQNERK